MPGSRVAVPGGHARRPYNCIGHLARSTVFSRSAVSRLSSVEDTVGEKIREITGRARVLPSAPNSDSLLCEWEGGLFRSLILTSTGMDHLPHNVSRQDESHIQTSFPAVPYKSHYLVCVCV